MSTNDLFNYTPRQFHWRRRLIVLAMALFTIAIVVRLLSIQVFDRDQWLSRAQRQYIARVRVMPSRGMICDRTGTVLATTLPTTSFALDIPVAKNVERIARAFEQAGIALEEDILKRVRQSKERNFLWLVRGVPLRQALVLDTLDDPGLIRIRELQRAYVFDSLAAQLLGTTDIDGHGIAGLELYYDSLLSGIPAERLMERIGQGKLRPVLSQLDSRAKPGETLYLTIDAQLQHIAEEALAESVHATGAQAGIVLALRPQTGEVLCCALQPAFSWQQRAASDALRLRAITDMYEPGSTLKVIVAAAALELSAITPRTLLDGHGGRLLLSDGQVITDHEPLGMCTLSDALVYSSNIVFAELAKRIGPRQLYRFTRDFGLGTRTGVDLPGEARGVLKTPTAMDLSDVMFMGFGYGIACTPLQLACAYAAIANNGVLMQPYVVDRITSADGALLARNQPQRIRRVISAHTAALLRSMMSDVVERGTGINARIQGMPIAGKTGTAQQWTEGRYSKQDYTASFVGMVPAANPSLVVLVMLDRPRSDIYGGSTAAPVFRRIIARIMNQPSLALRYGFVMDQPSTASSDSVTVPDVRGLQGEHAITTLSQYGLRGHIPDGNDNLPVVEQQPAAGSIVAPGSTVILSTDWDSSEYPKLVGLPLRQAVALVHSRGAIVEIHQGGRVRSYRLDRRGNRLHVVLNP